MNTISRLVTVVNSKSNDNNWAGCNHKLSEGIILAQRSGLHDGSFKSYGKGRYFWEPRLFWSFSLDQHVASCLFFDTLCLLHFLSMKSITAMAMKTSVSGSTPACSAGMRRPSGSSQMVLSLPTVFSRLFLSVACGVNTIPPMQLL